MDAATAKADECLQSLSNSKNAWVQLGLAKKVAVMKEVKTRLLDYALPLAHNSATVKCVAGTQEGTAVEYIGFTVILAMYLNRLIATYEEIIASGRCPQMPTRTLPNGQLAVRVTPATWLEQYQVLCPGLTVDLHLMPGATASQGSALLGEGRHEGRVCVVLGAGNQAFLGLKDTLHCLFERNEVVLFKPHPLHDSSTPLLEAALQPLVDLNAYRVLPCDGPLAKHVVYHPTVDCVHMTGGLATHDAIVWGPPGEEQARRKAANDPLLKVPMTSELGCITPFIIAPGAWTPKEMAANVGQIAIAATSNAGCNCLACKVVLLPGDWDQADELIDSVREMLKATGMQPAYYPGIHERYKAWQEVYPDAEVVAGPEAPGSVSKGGYLPVLMKVMEHPPEDPLTEYTFQVEPFAPTLVFVKLPTSGVEDFLEQSTAFCNDKLWGTLSCTLVVDPRTEKAHQGAVDAALANLQYGAVCKNAWSVAAFVMGANPWGAFNDPSKPLQDVRTGMGLVGNPLMYDHVQKSVVSVPFAGFLSVSQPPHVLPIPLAAPPTLGHHR